MHRHDREIFLVPEGTPRVVEDGQEHEAGAGSADPSRPAEIAAAHGTDIVGPPPVP